MVLSVAGRRDGEQRRDRPALDDLEAIVDQAPFDVLGAAEVRFDPPAELRLLTVHESGGYLFLRYGA